MKSLFRPLVLPLIAALAVTAAPLRAETERPVVVELFTSQGCSSCPAADALLADLAPREDVIALALHVDYWDYIGWEDPFADPAHAERQRGYAVVGGRHSVFTPQMIVQGETEIVGAKPMKLMRAIEAHAETPSPVALTLTRKGEAVEITATEAPSLEGPVQVHLLRYAPLERTKVTRGENAGHVMDHANVVQGWTVLGDWDGKTPLALEAEAPGDLPVVVLLQRAEKGGPGPILAAARLR